MEEARIWIEVLQCHQCGAIFGIDLNTVKDIKTIRAMTKKWIWTDEGNL